PDCSKACGPRRPLRAADCTCCLVAEDARPASASLVLTKKARAATSSQPPPSPKPVFIDGAHPNLTAEDQRSTGKPQNAPWVSSNQHHAASNSPATTTPTDSSAQWQKPSKANATPNSTGLPAAA